MEAIFNLFRSLVSGFFNGLEFLKWLLQGLSNLVIVMNESVNILNRTFEFFPDGIVTTLTAMLGGLVALRIFGRS